MRKLILVFFAVCLLASTAAVPKTRNTPAAPKPVDIDLVVDSAMILADDYVEAVTNKPEMANTRLNAIKRFYTPYASNKVVSDSICNSIYNFYVDNIERDKVDRANAFKECFLALADKDNSNLGPLYATELVLARENYDTTAIKDIIPVLTDYANLLDVDYDSELAEAQDFIDRLRRREPIEEAIAGVWVMEDICRDDVKGDLYNSLKILQIRNTAHPVYDKGYGVTWYSQDSITKATKGEKRTLDVIKSKGYVSDYNWFSDHSYYPIEAWELEGFNMKPLPQDYVAKTSVKKYGKTYYQAGDRYSRVTQADNQAYAMYVLWGDERLKRNDAETTALLRQGVQHIRSSIAGELSRSRYSTSTTIVGNMAADITAGLINGIIDILSVSKEKFWCIELILYMVNRNTLIGDIYTESIEVRSDNLTPKVERQNFRKTFYRWEPEDDVCFLAPIDMSGTKNMSGAKLNAKIYTIGGPIILHNLTKEDDKAVDRATNEYKNEYKNKLKDTERELKEDISKYPKNSEEYKAAKNIYKQFKKGSAPHVFMVFNQMQLDKLKAKAEQMPSL